MLCGKSRGAAPALAPFMFTLGDNSVVKQNTQSNVLLNVVTENGKQILPKFSFQAMTKTKNNLSKQEAAQRHARCYVPTLVLENKVGRARKLWSTHTHTSLNDLSDHIV